MAVLWAALSFTKVHEHRALGLAGRGAILVIDLEHYVGEIPLKMDTLAYTNPLGQYYSVTKFKYYISNIQLEDGNGKFYSYPGSHLVDEEDAKSQEIWLGHVRNGKFVSMLFTIGVDSIHNCSGAQSGDLDPLKGMFWTWNSGYIFFKLEGKSPASHSPGSIFEFHVGGYRKPYNNLKGVELKFADELEIVPGQMKIVRVKADIAQVFRFPNDIDLSVHSSITEPSQAGIIANNYTDMFSIITTH
ncbi:MAG TPA: MbnP family protein [Bacteroidia bacterium]